jgi:predicted AAA+ superfamily ATPase
VEQGCRTGPIPDHRLRRPAHRQLVVAGGFPDARERAPHQRSRYFRSYLQTIFGRDLPEIGEVRIDSSTLEAVVH